MKKLALIQILLLVMIPVVQAVTLQGPDVTGPTITDIAVIPGDTTHITWETNEPATSRLDYGTTQDLELNKTDATLVTDHDLELVTQENQTYYYKITSCDDFGNCESSTVESFVASAFDITADIPRYASSTSIDVAGTTRPDSQVEVHVNDVRVRSANIEDGTFLFRNVKLSSGTNTIKITAIKDEDTISKTYTVDIDSKPALMNITVEPAVTTPQVTATVDVNEPVNLTIKHAKPTGTPPPSPRGITEVAVSDRYATLSWENVTDAPQYGIYRNGKRIAVTPEITYSDESVGSGNDYQYQVTSVNDNCLESSLSTPLNITTDDGDKQEEQRDKPYFNCEVAPINKELSAGSHDISIDLKDGQNLLVFTAEDKAGFKTVLEERVYKDAGPPQILEHNLDQLSPSYEREVTVRGKLSEQGSITIFVNDKPQTTQPTDEDGNFAIDITLEREPQVRAPPITGNQAVNTELAWTSSVRIEAVDAVGLTAKTEDVDITYAICGTGQWVNVQITEPMPNILSPKLFMEGLGQVGLGFDYEYNGGYDATINHGGIRVTKLKFSPEIEDDYDNQFATPYLQVQPGRGDKPNGKGYIQLNFQPITNPWEQLPGGDDDRPDDWTAKDAEQRISEHRRNDCLIPGLGCIKLFLELEIPVTERQEGTGYDPNQPQPQRVQSHVQKTCIQMEVAIDQSFRTTDILPSKWLQGVSDFLGSIIDGIDSVLKPIETIGKYLFYGCTASTLVNLVPTFMEKYHCEYKKFESAIAGGGAFNPLIAEIDACDTEYGEDSEEAANCNSCAQWKNTRRDLEAIQRQLCDRVGCPAAPSLQYYLKLKGNDQLKQVPASAHTIQEYSEYAIDGKLYAGNDCSAWMKDKQIRESKADENKPPSLFFTPSQVEDIYTDWLDHKDDSDEEETGTVNCNGVHPATPECCGYAYVEEWGSACGITAFGTGLDTFDEIKESTCLSAQKLNRNEIPGTDGTTQECNNPLNAVGGFCDPQGQATPEAIKVVLFEGANVQTSKLQQLGLAGTKEQYMYFLIIPTDQLNDGLEYDLKLGYIVENVEFSQKNQSTTIIDDQKHYITAKMQGIELPESWDMQQTYFTPDHIAKHNDGRLRSESPEHYTRFQEYLCRVAGYTGGGCGANGYDIYDRVVAHIGTPDQEYIIRPRDGLINSIRCLCFPALIAYLKQIKNIMVVVQNCINTIVLTGDGEAGACQAAISEQVCDLIYEILTCFTNKFSSGAGRVGIGGDIFGALTAAGNDISQGVQSRYGEGGLYKSVFVDQKLTHSICMFAFTGTWNFDLDVAYDQTIEEFPIESQALIYPATRRFLAFNPTTQPPGLVDWVYSFGIMFSAGADVDLKLKLKCSGGFNCRESDGFENGKCDCDAPREITIYPRDLPSKVKKGDIITPEVLHVLRGGPGDGQIRYDKAYLEYTWRDAGEIRTEQTEEITINQVGGASGVPAFCRFFALPPSFRCQFAESAGGIRIIGTQTTYPHEIEET